MADIDLLKKEISFLTHKNELEVLKHKQEVLNLKGEINELEISLSELKFQHKQLCNVIIANRKVITELKLQIN
jgi:hypothetical protein